MSYHWDNIIRKLHLIKNITHKINTYEKFEINELHDVISIKLNVRQLYE